jgi:hypothetical protein
LLKPATIKIVLKRLSDIGKYPEKDAAVFEQLRRGITEGK